MIEIIIKLSSKTKIWNFCLGHIFSWSCCSLTFLILHFEVYDILKRKNFLIGFLKELSNFNQKKNFTFPNVIFFSFYSNWPNGRILLNVRTMPKILRYLIKVSTLLSNIRFSAPFQRLEESTQYGQWTLDSLSKGWFIWVLL